MNIEEKLSSLKLEFAKATDVTSIAKELNPLYSDYDKIYILPDTLDVWLIRVQHGVNENYEEDPNAWILERDKIGYEDIEYKEDGSTLPYRGTKEFEITKKTSVKWLLENDGLGSWDVTQFESLEECIEAVDGGFGIFEE